ncbi:MAG: WS/DGAT domain-containing protein [Solirubrobacteraceae bacterium]|nr:WS/DGAT domain-containing protein [Solirubrobacteraceae bacterium]
MTPTADRSFRWGTDDDLSPIETVMWRAERDPALRSTIVGFELLSHAPDHERLRAAHEWATRAVPRFRRRVDDPGIGAARWVSDERFDLDHHLRRRTLPDGATLDDALDAAAEIAMEPFDRSRPPWEAILLEGLPDGAAAYVLKLHHSSTDGIGIVQLLEAMHSRTAEPTEKRDLPLPAVIRPRSRAGTAARLGLSDARRVVGLASSAAGALRRPARLARGASTAVTSARSLLGDPPAAPSPLLADRDLTWRFVAHEMPFKALRDAGKAAGGTVNDAYLAALLGAFARYHDAQGAPVPAIPIAIPVSVRKAHAPAGGNQFAAARMAGPLDERDPVRRMQAIGAAVRAARHDPALDALSHVTPVMARLPAPVVARMLAPAMRGTDLQASNVPGIREPVYLAGARVERLYPYAPLPGAAAMITLVSHGDRACVGANLDAAAVADVPLFRRSLVDAFDEVLAVA